MNAIPSLESICASSIAKDNYMQTFEGSMKYYSFFRDKSENMSEVHSILFAQARKCVLSYFPVLLDKYGEEQVKDFLSPDDYVLFMKDLEEREAIKRKYAYKGTVLEKPSCVDVGQNENGEYPLRALLQGVEWPAGVDVSKREQYLSAEEFLSVFRITKEQFNALDKYKRMALKKEHKLF